MKDDFDYQSVPFNYIHCFNENCPRKDECLRHLTGLCAPKNISTIKTFNPAAYPADTDNCPYFRSARKIRLAWGISTMFDNIPYRTAVLLQSAIHQLILKPPITALRIRNVRSRPKNKKILHTSSHRMGLKHLPSTTDTPKDTIGTSTPYLDKPTVPMFHVLMEPEFHPIPQ